MEENLKKELEQQVEVLQNEKNELISKYRYWRGECHELKHQLEELEASYNSTMRYLNATRSQLLNLPNKIVEEIRKDMSERIIEKQIKWKDNIQISFICNMINESLDTILKKYEVNKYD